MKLLTSNFRLLLFAIIFLVILRDELHWITGTLGLIGITVLLMLCIKWYKKARTKK